MKYFRIIEDPTDFFNFPDTISTDTGQCLLCFFFCGAMLTHCCCFCGKGIGNKIGLHEKAASIDLYCMAERVNFTTFSSCCKTFLKSSNLYV